MESESLGQTIGQISELTHLVPIKEGYLEAEQYRDRVVQRPLTYRLRLEFLLAGLTKLESRYFPTPVRRLGVIHAARWAIVDLEVELEPAATDTERRPQASLSHGKLARTVRRPYLLFATQYDGSWHDYIKQFSAEVWPLMDMIWSNCVSYEGAQDFARLSRFVEDHQVKSDAFYVDAAQLSVGEVRQLDERRRRELELHVPQAIPSQEDMKLAAALFDKLAEVYPKPLFDSARALLLPWLLPPGTAVPSAGAPYAASQVQPHVITPLDVDCAVLFFVRFDDAAQARAAIDRVRCASTESTEATDARGASARERTTGGVQGWNIGLSYAGLDLLEVPSTTLTQLGEAFRAGMHARAAHLGDLPSDYPGDTEPVHACFCAFGNALGERGMLQGGDAEQLRSALQRDLEAKGQNFGTDLLTPLGVVHERLTQTFVELMQDVPLHRVREQRLHRLVITPAGQSPRVYEYFGFEDGAVSASAPSTLQRDADARRALFHSSDPLLENGTFLVLRKLEQDVSGFHQWASAQPELAEQMVGRKHHGEPLGSVDFSGDEQGKKCPLQSHVRRANPRTPESKRRELVRRGMSYLEKGGRRGLMFIGYNADIRDQFEFVQRNWIARGDAARGFREDVDPLIGRASPSSRFDLYQGEQRRSVKLSPKPFVTLRDGGYFFVPSLSALSLLTQPACAEREVVVQPFHPVPSRAAEQFWQKLELELDDSERSPAWWKRLGTGVQRSEHAVFVAGADNVRQVLSEDHNFSVCEFGRRMDETTGKFFLGMDPVDAEASRAGPEARTYQKQRQIADLIIPMSGTYGRPQPGQTVELAEFERHRKQAADWGRAVLRSMSVLERYADVDGKLVTRYELDSRRFIAALLGKLTGVLFGVEDPIDYKLAAWSGEVSLHVFRECPVAHVRSEAVTSGADFRGYVAELVALVRSGGLGQTPFNNQLRAVIAKFDALCDPQDRPAFADDRELVATLVGIVSGALATTASLFSQGLSAYAKQQKRSSLELPKRDPGPALTAAMQDRGRSVPDRIYRVCRNDTTVAGVAIAAGTLVVVGQGSALSEHRGRPGDISFFGHGSHHCPAERLALAMIDGAALALADQGTLTILDEEACKFSVSL